MSAAPSCAVVGLKAAQVARRALRRSAAGAEPALLVRWGAGPARRGQPSPLRPTVRRAGRVLAGTVPEGWSVALDGRVITVDVPAYPSEATDIVDLVRGHRGAVAVAIGLARCDAVDQVLRVVDEVVVIEPSCPALLELAQAELTPVVRSLAVVPSPRSPLSMVGGERGQATVVALAVMAAVFAVAVGLALVASALGRASDTQGRADVAALAGAKALLAAQPLRYSPDPAQRISVADYEARGLRAARASAEANGLVVKSVTLAGDRDLRSRVLVVARTGGRSRGDRPRLLRSTAEVALAALGAGTGAGDYTGALAVRQGQRMRPDVAQAFDRMQTAAKDAGHALSITSAYRSDAEQAELWRRNPDPRWVARPGTSLHRLGTELDLGPNSAWGWLAANCERFGFRKRYPWEAWHFGYVRSPGSTSLGYTPASGTASPDEDDGHSGDRKAAGSAIPSFVPATYAPMISRASQRWSVGAALLGAQLYAESQFDPRAVSGVGAAGIAQFMPGTAAMYGLTPAERFDPAKAINAQGHLMHDLLRQFGSVPLALAAYNAGSGAVARCMCIPPYPETQGYVQKILALLGGAGIAAPAGLQIRLVA